MKAATQSSRANDGASFGGEIPPRWAVTSFVITSFLVILLFYNHSQFHYDFIQYYIGAKNLAETGDPYSRTGRELGLATPMENCYPPLISYMCLPMARLPFDAASRLWLGFNLALTAVLAWQLVAAIPLRGASHLRTWLLALGFLMAYPPQLTGTSLGQVSGLVAVLICGAYLGARADAGCWAGLLLGWAALLKIFPGFLIPGFFLAGRRRTAVVAALVCALFVGLTWEQHREYLRRYVMTAYYPVAAQCFVSIPAMAARLFRENPYSIPAIRSEFLYKAAVVAGCAAIALGLARLLFSRPRGEWIIAAFLYAMMLVTPPSGYYHLNLALVGAALIYRGTSDAMAPRLEPSEGLEQTGKRSRSVSRWMVLALILTALPVEYGLTNEAGGSIQGVYRLIHSGWGTLLLTPQSYGLALLFVMCCRGPAQRAVSAPRGQRSIPSGDHPRAGRDLCR